MNRKILYVGLVAALVTWGGREIYLQSLRGPSKPPIPQKPNHLAAAWHRDSKLPWEFDPAAAAYRDPRVGQALQLIDREIRSMAEQTGTAKPPEYYPFYTAGDRPGPGYYRKYRANSNHFELEFDLHEAQPELNDFQFRCNYHASNSWNVTWRIHVYGKVLMFDELQVGQPDFCLIPISLRPGSQEFRYQEGDYNTYSTSRTLSNNTHADYARNRPAKFAELWLSPESFQQAAFVELDSYAAAIGDWYAAGGQVRKFYPYRGDGTAPEEDLSPNPHRLPIGSRTQLAVQAGTINMIRRQIVMTHAAEMQQALQESFPPMLELLKLFETPVNAP